MQFFLGTHHPHWLRQAGVPLFVSHRRLRRYKTLPKASSPWALDSGGFSELSLFGRWETSQAEYVDAVVRYQEEAGSLAWAAPQDWMCEPFITAKTGLDVLEHQRRTVASVVNLRKELGSVVAPVLQGFQLPDYHRHVAMYAASGIDLESEPTVGIGSVCRRQNTQEITDIVSSLQGLRLHGFGVKVTGLANFGHLLQSADSMSWSLTARRLPALDGCVGHKNCANCLTFALQWRQRLLGD